MPEIPDFSNGRGRSPGSEENRSGGMQSADASAGSAGSADDGTQGQSAGADDRNGTGNTPQEPGPDGGRDGTGGAGAEAGTGTAGGASNAGTGNASGGTGAGSAPMSRDDQLAVLDEALGQGYEDFDGLIIAERARARQQANAAGADAGGLSDEQGDGRGGSGQRDGAQGAGGQDGSGRNGSERPPMPGGNQGGGQVIARGGVEGEPQPGGSGGSTGGLRGGPSTGGEGEESYPVPEDIPEGRDDDVVARQIREAAMNEPDPELREALWDEYRRYTGLEE